MIFLLTTTIILCPARGMANHRDPRYSLNTDTPYTHPSMLPSLITSPIVSCWWVGQLHRKFHFPEGPHVLSSREYMHGCLPQLISEGLDNFPPQTISITKETGQQPFHGSSLCTLPCSFGTVVVLCSVYTWDVHPGSPFSVTSHIEAWASSMAFSVFVHDNDKLHYCFFFNLVFVCDYNRWFIICLCPGCYPWLLYWPEEEPYWIAASEKMFPQGWLDIPELNFKKPSYSAVRAP